MKQQQNKEEKSWWDKAVTQYQENKFSIFYEMYLMWIADITERTVVFLGDK